MNIAVGIKDGESEEHINRLLLKIYPEDKAKIKHDYFYGLNSSNNMDPYNVARENYNSCLDSKGLNKTDKNIYQCFNKDFYYGYLSKYIGRDISEDEFLKIFKEKFPDIQDDYAIETYELKSIVENDSRYDALKKNRIVKFETCAG